MSMPLLSNSTAGESVDSKTRWCWIGPQRSTYLDELIEVLAAHRPDQSIVEIQWVDVNSRLKRRKLLGASRADVFVWWIPESGIGDLVCDIAVVRSLHPACRQIAAGIVSPAELTFLTEAGIAFCVEQPHHWSPFVADRSRAF